VRGTENERQTERENETQRPRQTERQNKRVMLTKLMMVFLCRYDSQESLVAWANEILQERLTSFDDEQIVDGFVLCALLSFCMSSSFYISKLGTIIVSYNHE